MISTFDSHIIFIGLKDHYRECNFKPTTCTNAGCNQNIPLCALAQHQEKECPFRNVVCHSCNSAIKWTEHAVSCQQYILEA